jgi:hypothetical protein
MQIVVYIAQVVETYVKIRSKQCDHKLCNPNARNQWTKVQTYDGNTIEYTPIEWCPCDLGFINCNQVFLLFYKPTFQPHDWMHIKYNLCLDILMFTRALFHNRKKGTNVQTNPHPHPFVVSLLKKHWKVVFTIHICIITTSLQINQIPTKYIQ